jgi:hypothetical protein
MLKRALLTRVNGVAAAAPASSGSYASVAQASTGKQAAGGVQVTTWCAISVGACRPGELACWGLPLGGAVGDQAGDGGVGLVEVPAAPEVALEGPPLLVLGVGVLYADAL